MRKGAIAVETTHIFPIIKKWLYSDHDVFVRELVSNGIDAIEKRRQMFGGPEKPLVDIRVDENAATISFTDNGVGMDQEEMEKYLGQIAFSGASEFVKKLQEKNISVKDQLIGQFGLGFYSAFMVARRVEVFSKSAKPGSAAALWACEGEADYEIGESDYPEVGTKIVLHLNDEAKEFANKERLRGVLKTYCNFMRHPVALDGEVVNTQDAIWGKRAGELQRQDYLNLYKYLYPFEDEPVFWIHFNLDYPFELSGVLFFPRIHRMTDVRRGNVQLYCKQVFVSDNVEDVVPEFLTLLKGVIDSPEIPLNVSRSALQGDPKIRMISEHIMKKVGDALLSRYQNESEQYSKDWEHLAPFVKIGLIQNEKFSEKAEKFLLFETSEGEFLTLAAYQEKYGSKLQDFSSEKKQTFLYAHPGKTSKNLLETLKPKALACLFMDSEVDVHVIQALEMRQSDSQFMRLDAALDKLLETEKDVELISGADQRTKKEKIEGFFKEYLKVKDLDVQVSSFKDVPLPATIKIDEFSRRLSDMMAFQGQKKQAFPEKQTLLVNSNHPLIANLVAVAQRPSAEQLLPLLCQQVYDLARLGATDLSREERDQFLTRSTEVLAQLTR